MTDEAAALVDTKRSAAVKVYSLPALGHTNVTMRLRLLAGGE